MDTRIHFFSKVDVIPRKIEGDLLGIRGRQANEFAELGFPILPGFIIDARLAAKLHINDIRKDVQALLSKCSGLVGKSYGDAENPMLVKVVVSPNLAVSTYPTLHNFGLVRGTIDGFAQKVGAQFAANEVLFLLRGMLQIVKRAAELEKREDDIKKTAEYQSALRKQLSSGVGDKTASIIMDEYAPALPQGFFDSALDQLDLALKLISRVLAVDDENDEDTAVMIQPMVYGNYGKDSCSGYYFTRNVVSGEKKIQGEFYREKFNEIGAKGQTIDKIGGNHYGELNEVAATLEDKFKEIRQVRFTVEQGKLWLIEQRAVDAKSTQADLKLLLDLCQRKIIDESYAIQAIQPARLNEILHPIIDAGSTKGLSAWKGGIAGAPGAAIGRVFFTTETLLEAQKVALMKNEDARFILCMPATFAEDVKAIELSTGVLSCEGGYSAHASVVARQYGKVSLVIPEMRIRGKKATIGDIAFQEGDYLTINVPYYGESSVYLGQAKLIEPDPTESGLLEFIDIAKKHLKSFHVRANADSPKAAALALSFGADGIGLCRTEHMFFGDERINIFREMILSDSNEERAAALEKLRPIQRDDFYGIFKAMKGKDVTIRLLDAPLHEFMPHNDDELKAFLNHLEKAKGKKPSKAEIVARIEALSEFNPMLGHRGCRIAVSYPEIYAMQVKAIFEAAFKLREEKTEVRPEIMIPIVMNAQELKLIIYGKKIEGSTYKGIMETSEDYRLEKGVDTLPFGVGTMIELPAAALGAGEIAKYGEFFSFGTNDLTQTTLGISRDDFTSFMPDYTRFDLMEGNPFSSLDPRVRELVALAVRRGRLTRPDLICGLCGEHGANPDNIRFCMEAGLNYVSCSSYSVPIAILATAQLELERKA